MDFKTIILAGLGREGRSSYEYFSKRYPAAQWLLCDDQLPEQLDLFWQHFLEEKKGQFRFLSDLIEQAPTVDAMTVLLVKTAGIPLEHPGISALLQAGATLTSNTAAFFAALPTLTLPPITIGVTGTKGKSTTASMIYHVLKNCGLPVVLAGNIGVPPLEALANPLITNLSAGSADQPPVVVLELSSHQLRELTVSPNIAVIQNITPEHLDYYQSFEQYTAAKAPIARYQSPQDWIVFNPVFAIPASFAQISPAQKIPFGLEKTPENHVYLEDGWLWYRGAKIIAAAEIPLVGQHNLLNTMPAAAVALEIFNCPADQVARAIRSFTALPHRLEFVATTRGVEYYNDSQATTPEATMAGLASFSERPIILLAGGSDKGVAFDELAVEILKSDVKMVLLFPPMGEKIKAALEAAAPVTPNSVVPAMQEVHSMAEAVQAAAASASPGSVVLLSPACASFGLFKNYQDRGDQFKTAVRSL